MEVKGGGGEDEREGFSDDRPLCSGVSPSLSTTSVFAPLLMRRVAVLWAYDSSARVRVRDRVRDEERVRVRAKVLGCWR